MCTVRKAELILGCSLRMPGQGKGIDKIVSECRQENSNDQEKKIEEGKVS